MLIRVRLLTCIAGALLIVACGDDSSAGGAGGGGQGQGGENVGAGNVGGENTGAGNVGGQNVGGSGGGGEGGIGGAGGTGGSGGEGGSGGAPPVLVNGCSLATAEDFTDTKVVNLPWSFTHQRCLRVDVGTQVVWTGDFTFHPLTGGVTGTPDSGSPITQSDQSGGSASVTFATAGDFPYYCAIHESSMQGLIYVVP